MQKIYFIIAAFWLPICLHAQNAFNSGGNTLKNDETSYAYSIGEVSGFSVQPNCMYTQGIIQPARFVCAPVTYDYNDLYEIKFYPNPTKGIIVIETDYPDFATYNIHAADGHLVRSDRYTYSTINISNLPAGAYLLKLFSSDYTITKSLKIIKQ